MKRWSFFVYGVACHAMFLGVYAYFCGFTGDFLVPKSIDTPTGTPLDPAIMIDVLLLLGFALPHTVMARPGFKRVWTRIIPEPIERSTYVLVSNLLLMLAMWQWRSIDAVIWDVRAPAARIALWSLFAVGWLLVPAVSFMINHFDLFGTRQVWLNLKDESYKPLPFRTPMLYASVRHPLYIGWGLAFWATPTMTAGHLLMASVLSSYMILATFVEEHDLVAHFGREYEQYRQRVPKFLPRIGGRSGAPSGEKIEPLAKPAN